MNDTINVEEMAQAIQCCRTERPRLRRGRTVLVQRTGTYVQRVEFNAQKWGAACENLSMMVKNRRISFPNDSDLIAELEVFTSASPSAECLTTRSSAATTPRSGPCAS